VLDPGLRNQVVHPSSKTFDDIDNAILHCPKDNFPYRRLLSFHAKLSFTSALDNGWIDQDTFHAFKDYSNVSAGANSPVEFDE
jgi:hypothetical protein